MTNFERPMLEYIEATSLFERKSEKCSEKRNAKHSKLWVYSEPRVPCFFLSISFDSHLVYCTHKDSASPEEFPSWSSSQLGSQGSFFWKLEGNSLMAVPLPRSSPTSSWVRFVPELDFWPCSVAIFEPLLASDLGYSSTLSPPFPLQGS